MFPRPFGFAFGEGLESQGYAMLAAKSGDEAQAQPIVIVDFEDATVEAIHEFPIPRLILVEALEKIASGEGCYVTKALPAATVEAEVVEKSGRGAQI